MALQFAAVANSIAGLSVSGVTLTDVDEIPQAGDTRTPSIIPAPNWMSDFTMERMSFGGGSSALMDLRYTLTYRLLYAPVGSGRGFVGVVDKMIDKLALFLDAVIAVDTLTGLVDITPAGVSGFGVVTDPSDNKFWGCDISLSILEFGPND
jgi:hypothetical protein